MHSSIAGGLVNAIKSATEKGSDCLQIFARNPRGWLARPLTREEISEFRSAREKAGLWPLAIHSVYLINLAATDPVFLARSREAFQEEVRRSIELGADYLVVHPGCAGAAGAEAGILTAVESMRECTKSFVLRGAGATALAAGRKNGLTILIENTAGQGSSIGCSFEQIEQLLLMLNDLPVDVCLDTAHTFASGYDISTEKGLLATIKTIDKTLGFNRIKLVHCNDSKVPLNSRVDRHQHIGLGNIGNEGFRRITHNLRFRNVPFILETPVDKERDYAWNLRQIRVLSAANDFVGSMPGEQEEVPKSLL
jgi:deoxyribonuclease IV